MKIAILGGGISGLSVSHFLENGSVSIYEKDLTVGGHCRSHSFAGCIFDEGPHLIFTKHEDVFDLLNFDDQLHEFSARIGNLWSDFYIDHPVIENLCQLPDAIRNRVWDDYITAAKGEKPFDGSNFADWCLYAYGEAFTDQFVRKYTKKYWQLSLEKMATDWMGPRLPVPNRAAVERGLYDAEGSRNHYISKFFYPKNGGFQSILQRMAVEKSVNFGFEIKKIDLAKKTLEFRNGEKRTYDRLINTLPLPDFVRMGGAPSHVLGAARQLQCTSLTIVNIVGERRTPAKYNWLYVYDEEYLSTRVSFVETLSKNNVANDKVALQIEVYDKGDQAYSEAEIKDRVCKEAIEQGWIASISDVMHQRIEYANVVSGIDRRANLDVVLDWLSLYGLVREHNDLEMVDDWQSPPQNSLGEIINIGRFAQWKYYWTDDCVMRAKNIAQRIQGNF